MRIGIMGGTFNPVHFGHLNSAEEIGEKFNLKRIIFVPTYITPYKEKDHILASSRRLEMLRIAAESNKRFSVSTIEIDRGGVSYSVDTVEKLKNSLKDVSSLYFIAGIDVFSDIAAWKKPEKLLSICNFIINTRPDYKMDDLMTILKKSITAKDSRIFFEYKGRDDMFDADKIAVSISKFFIYTTKTTSLNISSTNIRKRISEGKTVKYLLSEDVERYIMKNNLYRTSC